MRQLVTNDISTNNGVGSRLVRYVGAVMDGHIPAIGRYGWDVIDDTGRVGVPFGIRYDIRQLMHNSSLPGATAGIYLSWMGTARLQVCQFEIDRQL